MARTRRSCEPDWSRVTLLSIIQCNINDFVLLTFFYKQQIQVHKKVQITESIGCSRLLRTLPLSLILDTGSVQIHSVHGFLDAQVCGLGVSGVDTSSFHFSLFFLSLSFSAQLGFILYFRSVFFFLFFVYPRSFPNSLSCKHCQVLMCRQSLMFLQ